MTQPSLTAQQHFALIKHLAGGKTADQVSLIFKITQDQVLEIAKHHGYPDTEKLAWAADILAKKLEENAGSLPASTIPPGASAVGSGAHQVLPPTTTGTRPDEFRVLINTAKQHPSKGIQNQANRVLDAVSKLRQMIDEDQVKHAEKRRLEAEKATARAEVERLKAELAAAQAKLRGKPAATKPATSPHTTTAPRGEYPCRNEGCDQIISTPQGRGLHERQHCEHRVDAEAVPA